VWDANFLQVEEVDDAITAGELAQEADRLMGSRGLAHRKIQLNDKALGSRLAPEFEREGWEIERLLFMVHNGEEVGPPSIPVDEVVEAVHTVAKDEFNRRNPFITEQKVIDEMRGLARRISEATDKRCFAASVTDEIASVCELYSDGLTAQIEDVATLEEHRSKGLAQAVVRRALHEAQTWGHETIFLVADEDDWPKEMYAKLGFEQAGRTYQFLLKPQT